MSDPSFIASHIACPPGPEPRTQFAPPPFLLSGRILSGVFDGCQHWHLAYGLPPYFSSTVGVLSQIALIQKTHPPPFPPSGAVDAGVTQGNAAISPHVPDNLGTIWIGLTVPSLSPRTTVTQSKEAAANNAVVRASEDIFIMYVGSKWVVDGEWMMKYD